MAINVTKISEAYYVATATPPHVREIWSTSEPLRLHKLSNALIEMGGHQVDIGDAVDTADRDWLEKSLVPYTPPWLNK